MLLVFKDQSTAGLKTVFVRNNCQAARSDVRPCINKNGRPRQAMRIDYA